MSDQLENFTLHYLRRIDEKLDGLTADVRDLKHRMSSVELIFGQMQATYAGMQIRLDRVDSRLERIERRLELRETTD